MLDSVVPDRPAFIMDNSGHGAWVNSRALAAAHITAATADPPNGLIERDSNGQPTGMLHEDTAMDLVRSLIPQISPEDQLANLSAALHEMSRLGITALEDAMVSPEIARAYWTLDQQLYPAHSLLDSGAVLVWGTDWPVTGVSPLDGLETAITHRYLGGKDLAGNEDSPLIPHERVSLEQAIAAYTSAGAYLMHDDTIRGSLSAGKAADLVVLDRNLFETAPLDIHKLQVDMTVIDGKVVFARKAN